MTVLAAAQHSTALGDALVILVSFSILLVLLNKFAYKPVAEILAKRQDAINGDLDKASLARRDAEKSVQEAKATIQSAREEAKEIVSKARKSALELQNSALAQARKEAEHKQESLMRDFEQQRSKMIAQMRDQVTELSVELASKILDKEINQADHQKMIDDFIDGME